ncbi:hypothetical protein BDW69DRAFT_177789 [Aspergillus filifer]
MSSMECLETQHSVQGTRDFYRDLSTRYGMDAQTLSSGVYPHSNSMSFLREEVTSNPERLQPPTAAPTESQRGLSAGATPILSAKETKLGNFPAT